VKRVVLVEHPVRLWLIDKLKHAALVTEGRSKFEEILCRDFLLYQKTICDRHAPE
jgi:hypothetical protein